MKRIDLSNFLVLDEQPVPPKEILVGEIFTVEGIPFRLKILTKVVGQPATAVVESLESELTILNRQI